jgi:hypothetical protein
MDEEYPVWNVWNVLMPFTTERHPVKQHLLPMRPGTSSCGWLYRRACSWLVVSCTYVFENTVSLGVGNLTLWYRGSSCAAATIIIYRYFVDPTIESPWWYCY